MTLKSKKFILIGTSQGGRNELVARLLESVANATYRNIEVIFVDQTGGSELDRLFDAYKARIKYLLLKSNKCSLSAARNLALSYANGDILGFCDDDAFYPRDFFEMMNSQIKLGAFEIVSVPVIDPSSGAPYGGRSFPLDSVSLHYGDVFRHSLSVGTFVSCSNYFPYRFNEKLGAGAQYGGSEETDFFLSLKLAGFDTRFFAGTHVLHDNDPPQTEPRELARKYYSYAIGYGAVLRKYIAHSKLHLSIELLSITSRSIAGCILSRNRPLYFGRLKGLIKGFLRTTI